MKHVTITLEIPDEEIKTYSPQTDFHIANIYRFELERKGFKNIISVKCEDV